MLQRFSPPSYTNVFNVPSVKMSFNDPIKNVMSKKTIDGNEDKRGQMKLLPKQTYVSIMNSVRENKIMELFGTYITEEFEKMIKEAEKCKPIHHEFTFDLTDETLIDIDKMEHSLTEFFKSIGYECILEPRKNDSRVIIITIV